MTLKARIQCKNVFKINRENSFQARIIYLAKQLTHCKGGIKTYWDNQGFKIFTCHTSFFRKLLENVLYQDEGVNQETGKSWDSGSKESNERERDRESPGGKGRFQDDSCAADLNNNPVHVGASPRILKIVL